MTDMFDPTAYVDEVRGPHRGGDPEEGGRPRDFRYRSGPPEGKGKVIDLMEALRASLEKTEKASARHTARQRKAPKRVEQAATPGPQELPSGNCRRESRWIHTACRTSNVSSASVARYDQGTYRRRLCQARARSATPVSLLLPGPDRPAHRARAHAGQRSAPRVRRALHDLRRNLPETMPLSGIEHQRGRRSRRRARGQYRWQVDDGQYLLGLDVVSRKASCRWSKCRQPVASAKSEPDTIRCGSRARARRHRPSRRTRHTNAQWAAIP